MRTYTTKEMRSAMLVAVLATAIAVIALLDPSCQGPTGALLHRGPSHSVAPQP